MKIAAFLLALPVVVACSDTSHHGQSYDDCVLLNLPNARTNSAIGAVMRSCRELHPKPEVVASDSKPEIDPAEFRRRYPHHAHLSDEEILSGRKRTPVADPELVAELERRSATTASNQGDDKEGEVYLCRDAGGLTIQDKPCE